MNNANGSISLANAVRLAAILALLSLTVLALSAVSFLRGVRQDVRVAAVALDATARETAGRLEARLTHEAEAYRLAAQTEAALMRRDLAVVQAAWLRTLDARAEAEAERTRRAAAPVVDAHADLARELRQQAGQVGPAATRLMTEARDEMADLYNDVRAGVQSGTVAARGVAEMSEALGKVAPRLAASADRLTDQTAGIATDVHRATSKFVGPKSKKQKAWEALRLAAGIASLAAF
jgi:hypothetical protein